jgi:hypothetical protein
VLLLLNGREKPPFSTISLLEINKQPEMVSKFCFNVGN